MTAAVLALLARAGIAMSWPVKWLVTQFLNYFFALVNKFIKKKVKEVKEDIAVKQAKKTDEKNSAKYEEVLKDENKTEADLDSATSNFLNGRK